MSGTARGGREAATRPANGTPPDANEHLAVGLARQRAVYSPGVPPLRGATPLQLAHEGTLSTAKAKVGRISPTGATTRAPRSGGTHLHCCFVDGAHREHSPHMPVMAGPSRDIQPCPSSKHTTREHENGRTHDHVRDIKNIAAA